MSLLFFLDESNGRYKTRRRRSAEREMMMMMKLPSKTIGSDPLIIIIKYSYSFFRTKLPRFFCSQERNLSMCNKKKEEDIFCALSIVLSCWGVQDGPTFSQENLIGDDTRL